MSGVRPKRLHKLGSARAASSRRAMCSCPKMLAARRAVCDTVAGFGAAPRSMRKSTMAPCPALAARIRGDHPSPSTAFTSAFPSRSAEASAKSQAPAASSSLCSSRASHWYVCVTVSRHAPWTQELVPASKYTCKRTQSLRSDTRGSKHAKELSTLPRAAQTTLRARRSARRLDDVFLSWPHAGTANVCLRGRGRTRSWPASPRHLLALHHPLRPP